MAAIKNGKGLKKVPKSEINDTSAVKGGGNVGGQPKPQQNSNNSFAPARPKMGGPMSFQDQLAARMKRPGGGGNSGGNTGNRGTGNRVQMPAPALPNFGNNQRNTGFGGPKLGTPNVPAPPKKNVGGIAGIPPPPTKKYGGAAGIPPPPKIGANVRMPPPPVKPTYGGAGGVPPPPPIFKAGGVPPPPTFKPGGVPPPPTFKQGGVPPPPNFKQGGVPTPPPPPPNKISGPRSGAPRLPGPPPIANYNQQPSVNEGKMETTGTRRRAPPKPKRPPPKLRFSGGPQKHQPSDQGQSQFMQQHSQPTQSQNPFANFRANFTFEDIRVLPRPDPYDHSIKTPISVQTRR